jgi:hypothetical protein
MSDLIKMISVRIRAPKKKGGKNAQNDAREDACLSRIFDVKLTYALFEVKLTYAL